MTEPVITHTINGQMLHTSQQNSSGCDWAASIDLTVTSAHMNHAHRAIKKAVTRFRRWQHPRRIDRHNPDLTELVAKQFAVDLFHFLDGELPAGAGVCLKVKSSPYWHQQLAWPGMESIADVF